MSIKFHGKNVVRDGIDGIDGDSTIGTVIAYMGTTAPKGYLACDGATYNISDYPDLANHFYTQFGSVSYFGGDGTSTFKVPDLRNLFLRGYHGDSYITRSGNIGVIQEATKHVYSGINSSANNNALFVSQLTGNGAIEPQFTDATMIPGSRALYFMGTPYEGYVTTRYESRPINMAVLYCIRAQKDNPRESDIFQPHVYSTEEVPIGIGMSGETIYRKCFYRNNLSYNNQLLKIDQFSMNISGMIDKFINLRGRFYSENRDNKIPDFQYYNANDIFQSLIFYEKKENDIIIIIYAEQTGLSNGTTVSVDSFVVAEYNKVQS